jgi:hypothetical protein
MDGAARLRYLLFLHAHIRACHRRQARRDTDSLLARLDAIADKDLRLHRFGELLGDRSSDAAAWTLAELQARINSGDPRARRVCTGLLDRQRLARVLAPQRLAAIRAALEALGGPSAGLLGEYRGAGGSSHLDETAPRPTDPVGYRITQARKRLPALLDQLLFDPDVRVVETVLGNPRLTEAEVVKLSAARRVNPAALRAIAADANWISRYAVKVALANNPTVPPDLVAGILPHLLDQDLRLLATADRRVEVRRQAAALLAGRVAPQTESGFREA